MPLPRFHESQRNTLGILSLALVARLLVLWLSVERQGITWLYSRGVEVGFVANALIHGHGFSSPFGGNTGATALIAPGYPLLVAAVFKCFGVYSPVSASIIMLAQVAVNLVTVGFIMQLARKLAHERAALLAGLFWACWPPLLWMPTIFWETSLSACLLSGMLLVALHIVERPTRWGWVCFGALCGIASLINMALLITLTAMLVWTLAVTFRTQKINAALAFGLFILLYLPWPIRNAVTFHAFVPLRTTVGLELWMGNHDGSTGFLEETLFPLYNKSEMQQYLRLGEIEYDLDKSRTAHAWIASHPTAFAKLSLLRAARFWAGSGTRHGSPIFIIGALLTTACGFWGLALLYRSSRSVALLLGIPLLLFPLPYYITHAEFRYRLVLDPILTVLASCALTMRKKSPVASSCAASTKAVDLERQHLVA